MSKQVLIDGDQIAYRACFSSETEIKWDEDTYSLTSSQSSIESSLEYQISQAKRDTGIMDVRVALSDSKNFRKDIYPDYKANRIARKPLGLSGAREYLEATYGAETKDSLEADDLIGMWAVANPDSIIWATDKDYLTVPCKLFRNGQLVVVTEADADSFLRLQTIIGDTADNYKGVKGFGDKTAAKWIEKHGDTWDSVKKAFESKNQTEEDYVTNARLARILRSTSDLDWRPHDK